MTKIHLIEDKTIGGVKREYIEVDGIGKRGHLVIIKDTGYITKVFGSDDNVIGDNRRAYEHGSYRILSSTDIVHIDGTRYRLSERKAEVGEKALVYQQIAGANGVQTVERTNPNGHIYYGVFGRQHGGYYVLTAIESEPAEPTPDIHDLIANLAQRVTSLERITGELVRAKSSLESQLRDTQNNVEHISRDHENVAFKVVDVEQSIGSILDSIESNTKDISFLDDRTYEKPGKPTKSAEELLRIISKLIEEDGGAGE